MICRRGKVVKADIGAIRITDNETRFEIANAVVERFTIASLVADDDDVKIELLKGSPEISRPSRNPDRKPNLVPNHQSEPQRYEDRKPHEGLAKPMFERTGYKGKKPFAEGKPRFGGAGKPHATADTPAFKEKKAAWKKKKR
jgi:ATP-dependent RNA helicase DeaD